MSKLVEEQVSRKAGIELNINVIQVNIPEKEGIFGLITVTVENKGSHSTTILHDANALKIYQASNFSEDGKPLLHKIVSEGIYKAWDVSSFSKANNLMPGMKKTIPFLIKFPNPGAYYVTFSATPSSDDLKAIPDPWHKNIKWAGYTYFITDSGNINLT